jgi:hypothetical protein
VARHRYGIRLEGEEGGHVTGGSLSLLFHREFGPILVASMTEYEMIEPPNQQGFTDAPHMPLTPRVECVVNGETYTSFSDFEAVLKVTNLQQEVVFDAQGRLLSVSHAPVPRGGVRYHMTYRVTDSLVQINATATAPPLPAQLRFVLPVISRTDEPVDHSDPASIRIIKPRGSLTVRTGSSGGFEALPKERTFNLVPGFECLPVIVSMRPREEIHIQLEASLKQ